jgi:hypothetical protein
MSTVPKFALVPDDPHAALVPLAVTKRAEFFLEEMLAAGRLGITTISYPGVRVGDAIHKLRKAGVNIETQYEQHGGEFAGHHGRYVLLSKVQQLKDSAAGASARIVCRSFLAPLLAEAVQDGLRDAEARLAPIDDPWGRP